MDIILQILVLIIIIVIALLVAQKLGLVYITSIFGGYGYNKDLPKDMNIMILSKLPIEELEKQRRVSPEVNSLFEDNYWGLAMKLEWLRSHGFAGRNEYIDPIHYDIEVELARFVGKDVEEEEEESNKQPEIIEIERFRSGTESVYIPDKYFHTQHYKLHPDILRINGHALSLLAPLKYIISHPEPDLPDCEWDIGGLAMNDNITLDFMEKNPRIHGMTWTPKWAENPNITLRDLNRLKWTLHGVKADVKEAMISYEAMKRESNKFAFTLEDIKEAVEILNLTPDEFRELNLWYLVSILSHSTYTADDDDKIIDYLEGKNFKLRGKDLKYPAPTPKFLNRAAQRNLII